MGEKLEDRTEILSGGSETPELAGGDRISDQRETGEKHCEHKVEENKSGGKIVKKFNHGLRRSFNDGMRGRGRKILQGSRSISDRLCILLVVLFLVVSLVLYIIMLHLTLSSARCETVVEDIGDLLHRIEQIAVKRINSSSK